MPACQAQRTDCVFTLRTDIVVGSAQVPNLMVELQVSLTANGSSKELVAIYKQANFMQPRQILCDHAKRFFQKASVFLVKQR